MSKEKQIEEMANLLCADLGDGCKDCPFEFYDKCDPKASAEELYSAGYRKQNDVVPKSEVIGALSDVKRQIHEKAIYPHGAGIKPYISLNEIDAILVREIEKINGERK